MKITDVRAVQPESPGCPTDWRLKLGQILVAVDTDSGVTGYGVGGGGAAGIHVIRSVLRDLLLGVDPAPVEELWRRMYRATLPFGRKGLAIMALSGVDLALWDLRGKVHGQPVAELLGGKVGQAVPGYITLTGNLETALDQGYQAFKLHLAFVQSGAERDQLVAHVERVRSAIGPARQLMLDAFMRWDVPTTIELAGALAPFNLSWLEEPLAPDDLAGYAQLVGQTPLPIAGGEHEFTAAAFAELIERRLHQVLQPDVCWCGGLTELVKIYRLARQAGVRVCPHRGGELWGLHAVAALDPQPLAESGRPWMTWVGGQPPVINGAYQLTDTPGFGAVIDESLLP